MVAKLKLRVLHLCLLLTLAFSYSVAQDSHPTSNAAPRRATTPSEGLLDFTLKKINPSGREYGQCLDDARKFVLEQTLNRAYFWTNLSALGLLGLFLVVIIHQQRLLDRRELIASESLTQYHNALARAEAVAAEAIKRNRALMETVAALSESPREVSQSSASKDSPGKERKRVQDSNQNGTGAPLPPIVAAGRGEFRKPAIVPSSAAKNAECATSKDRERPEQTSASGDDADLTAKINSLQQQLDVHKEEKKQLLRQVSFAELRLQKEQQKNRSLKGE